MTREEKFMDTDLWKRGEWFTVGRAAQSTSGNVEQIATMLDGMYQSDLVEKRRVSGKAMTFRPRKPFELLRLRKRTFEWEGEYSPQWY